MNTLTSIGTHKIGQHLISSIDHAAYTLDGQPRAISIFRATAVDDKVAIYVYFDDTIVGTVANVQLIDKDGDVIAEAYKLSFKKPATKGLYVAFKYDIKELGTEVIANESV